jgi:hypothetical protein
VKPTLEGLLRNAFLGMLGGPQPLKAAMTFYAQQSDFHIGDIESTLQERVAKSPNDEVRQIFNDRLKFWDWEAKPPWAASTESNTHERRVRIYELLRLGVALQSVLDEFVPPYEGPGNVIVEAPRTDDTWYTSEFRQKYDFYWPRLREFLTVVRGIPSNSINSMDAATTAILDRLPNPADRTARAARGLIVGYVQSGKTTNFTGVIAKAIDAGYRLIIVLSGTTNLLRNQTQRRIDMDLVGVENVLRGAEEHEVEHDYKTDEDWPARFISYGRRPSLFGHVDITRLTGHQDFQSVDAGINPLEFEFEKKDKQRPLFDRENLDHAGARIVVVKKQRDRLDRLLRDLKAVSAARCAEIPTLLIDDESDQASVNTVNPHAETDNSRTSINERIVEILRRLPRAQYLGYTATPFANVFVNLDDPEDIYPRDFMISLDRPEGYMGARDFVDLAAHDAGTLSNEQAFVRGIPGPPPASDDRLLEAIDAFVLTGALKKFREKSGGPKFKHHTMLVHQSPRKAHHQDTVREIQRLWQSAAYDSPGATTKRLEQLLVDFRKVWADRGQGLKLAFPKDFNELKPALGQALAEIRRGEPILMVNSAEGAQVPNFDTKEGVWKIIVGGAKLSRGYTIEGLTVSYFRRCAKMQDTLMQMGRWCGFRAGYDDLVRLYIGRTEPDGKHKTLDLYKAFEVMCRDEEDFRNQLAMYAKGSGITPKDIPALVFNSHPQLRPAARNKMFNAELVWAAFNYREPTRQAIDNSGTKHNAKLFESLFRKYGMTSSDVDVKDGTSNRRFKTISAEVPNVDVIKVLEEIEWDGDDSGVKAEIAYLRKESPVDSWIVLAPQIGQDTGAGSWQVGATEFQCISRTRFDTRFGVFSSPEHVSFAKWLVGQDGLNVTSPKLKPRKRMGVLLLYPTKILGPEKKVKLGIPVMGFSLTIPTETTNPQRVAFRTRMKAVPNAIVVDIK